MNKILATFILLISLLIVFPSCNDEGGGEQEGENLPDKYFINLGEVYETPRAFLDFSSVVQYDSETQMDVLKYQDRVQLIFTNGNITFDDGVRVYSENTTHFTSISLRDLNGGVLVDSIGEVLLSAGEYTMSPGTTTVINGSVDVSYTEGVTNYGELNGYYLPLTNEDSATIEIVSLSLDYETLTGFIEAEYKMEPGIDGSISGSYSGTLEIIK